MQASGGKEFMDNLFKYDCNLNIEGFVHMLDDPTECYKFYWLDSIMQLLAENKETLTFDNVISGMIADAWHSVTEYHLHMGTLDSHGNSVNSIERAVNKLNALGCVEHNADRETILLTIREHDALIHEEKYQISKNVPYRLLSCFFENIGGNDPIWEQKAKLIAYLKVVNERKCIPYIVENKRGLAI